MAKPIHLKLLHILQSLAKSRGLIPIIETKKYIAIFFKNSYRKLHLLFPHSRWQRCRFLPWLESSPSLSPVPAVACLGNQLPSCNLSLQLVPVQCYRGDVLIALH